MKKPLLLIFFTCSLFISNIGAQTFKILDVNVSNFPIIDANILAYDATYNANALHADSLTIFENNQQLQVLEFKAPKSSIIPTSIVILLDISASMVGTRFDMLKKTAKEFIQNLPLEISEVALASFSDDIILNCDFTHNIQTLNQSIDLLNTAGGTSYDRAFLNPFAGALNVAKQGQYKRVIIFITDGLSDVKHYEVTNKAIYDSIFVNCITIGLPITDELKYITDQTGGRYYSDLNYEDEIKSALEKIYTEVQVNTFGNLKWMSNYSCNPHKTNIIKLCNQVFKIEYQIPDSLVGTIETTPTTLNFSKGSQKISQYKPVYIRGNNMALNITSITSTNNSLFSLVNENFPIRTHVNELKTLEFSFTPNDSIYATADYTIHNQGCPEVIINAASEGVKKLVITSPAGNEIFVRGEKIPIIWNGVDKSTSVDFSYQIKGIEKWCAIGSSTQYKKNWVTPALNETIRIQGQVTNNITLPNLLNNGLQIIDGKQFKSSFYSPDGSEIITISTKGLAKNWNAETGEFNHSFEKLHQGDVVFFPGYNRIVSFSDSTFEVFTNRNGLLMASLPLGEKKILSSFTHIHDKELYATLINYSSLYQSTSELMSSEYLDCTTSPHGNYTIARSNSTLTIFKPLPLKKWFTIKLNQNFKKAILHNSKDFVVVLSDSSTVLYNLNTKQLVKDFHNEHFIQYTASGKYLITESNTQIIINNLETGARHFALPNTCKYTFSNNGLYTAWVCSDTLIITDLVSQKDIWKKPYNHPQQLQFFPKTNRLVFLQKDSLTIVNFETKHEEFSVYVEPNLVKMFEVAPNEKSLLITSNQVVSVWDIKTHFDADTTPWFNIISPQPKVTEVITFPKQYITTSTEKVFANVIRNTTTNLVFIDSLYIEGGNADFTLVSSYNSMNLKPSQSKSVEIRFSPKTVGISNATLVVVSSNKKYFCKLSGIGINQAFKLPTPILQFQPLLVGVTADTVIPILINTGTEAIRVNGIELAPKMAGIFKLERMFLPKVLNTKDTLWTKASFNSQIRGRNSAMLQLKLNTDDWIKATEFYGVGEAKRWVVIAGKTIHAISRKSLESVIILTELNSGKITQHKPTGSDGRFVLHANTDLNYSISAQLEGYFSSSVNIDLIAPQTTDTLFTEIELTPMFERSTVKLNNIFFESGKADLLDISKTEILRVMQVLKEQGKMNIEIHGHTDNIGEVESNMKLSQARAAAVKEYIIGKGISANRIDLKCFGETQPIENNSDEKGRKANRRVEIRFIE